MKYLIPMYTQSLALWRTEHTEPFEVAMVGDRHMDEVREYAAEIIDRYDETLIFSGIENMVIYDMWLINAVEENRPTSDIVLIDINGQEHSLMDSDKVIEDLVNLNTKLGFYVANVTVEDLGNRE